ncbi:uncharacterized protein METZ01_LOCUS64757 [marine metagenome]|uniref:Uncharacterized protein n=1 Tax=marine metagenome TaxID=408172 RepID=A0A381TD99_9ZZZZ
MQISVWQALEGCNPTSFYQRNFEFAGIFRPTVHQYSACTAMARATPILRRSQSQFVSQHIEQWRTLCRTGCYCLVIDDEFHYLTELVSKLVYALRLSHVYQFGQTVDPISIDW